MNTTMVNCQACTASLNLDMVKNGIVKCEYCGTTHNLSQELTRKVDFNEHQFSVKLHHLLSKRFNIIDLQTLVYEFSVCENVLYYNLDWEDLQGGSVRKMKAMYFVQWCKRNVLLQDFVDFLLIKHPYLYGELI